MENIKEIKPGTDFFDVTVKGIIRYQYLCKFPTKNESSDLDYHIIIDKRTEDPLKIYGKKLKEILDKNIMSYDEAKNEYVMLLERHLNFVKESHGK